MCVGGGVEGGMRLFWVCVCHVSERFSTFNSGAQISCSLWCFSLALQVPGSVAESTFPPLFPAATGHPKYQYANSMSAARVKQDRDGSLGQPSKQPEHRTGLHSPFTRRKKPRSDMSSHSTEPRWLWGGKDTGKVKWLF